MRKDSLLKGLVSIVGGTALGLAGCRNEVSINRAPEISVSEVDGTPINSTNNNEIIENNDCDEVYFLAIPRGNLENNELDLMVNISDPEKRLVTFNPYSIQQPENNNPINIRYTEVDSSVNSVGEKYDVNVNIEIIANGENTSLGAHHAFNISYSDGGNDRVACFYNMPVPGSTVPPGEIPQVDNGNNDVDCHYNSDCDVHETCDDGKCVPHQDNNNSLDDLINKVCNLTRSTGTDIKFYELAKDSNGEYNIVKELGELTPNLNDPTAEGNSIHHLIPTGTSGKYFAAVGGMQTGNYTILEVVRVREMAKVMSSSVGMVPEQCDYTIILNPNGESLDSQVFSVTYNSN